MSEAFSSGELGSWRASSEEKRHQKQDDENTKENLRNPRRRARDSSEAQNRRDERNDQEGKCPTKHKFLSIARESHWLAEPSVFCRRPSFP
jgi:hypothetical protein